MDDVTLSHQIYSGYRISMTVFTYLPKVSIGYKSSAHNIAISPIMMISYKPAKGAATNFKENFFKVTPKNLYRTIKFFNQIVSWFYDKDLQDLFLRGEKNELIFNADYNKLKAVTSADPNNLTAMRAVPNVIHYDDGKDYEGIYLYINKMENVVPMPLHEIEDILDILAKFSFEASVTQMVAAYDIAKRNDMITSDEYYGNYKASQSSNQWS